MNSTISATAVRLLASIRLPTIRAALRFGSLYRRLFALAASGDAFEIYNADFTAAKIAINDMEGSYFNRSRFSGGHEVGHIHLEHTEHTPNREAEADYYAGYLLAPHPLVLTMPKEASIADKFGISQWCADFAYDQAEVRRREGGPWRPHEK